MGSLSAPKTVTNQSFTADPWNKVETSVSLGVWLEKRRKLPDLMREEIA